ncbi:MAG TPA: SDR family NAD(P)-dependent oxidoreductase, partial [Vicinamibacterales bacterium]|nr:SDR family NAD(P)-dependent oxidoreductase [Vicinamibacterales bacterium]
MLKELAGSVAVVTGGSGGIGRAIIARLGGAGAKACCLDLVRPSDGSWWVETNVSDERSLASALDDVNTREGRLDILVHAAGISFDAVVWKTPAAEWDRVQAVNLRGAFLMLSHGIPLLRRAGGGRAVLIGSINGSRGKFGTSAYSASKAGLVGLARTVAREAGRFGVTVNVIEPGWVRTPLTEKIAREFTEAAIGETLAGR